MKIHDILVNCRSLQYETLIISFDENKEIKWCSTFINLPKGYDKLKFKYFTVGVTVHEYAESVYFKFYV